MNCLRKAEFYVPRKGVITVIRETAESTKMRIVFDTSAEACQGSPSLIDHLETGQPLQNWL